MESFEAYLARQSAIMEEALDEYLPGAKEHPSEIYQAMRYSVFAGGKRLRPILCLAAAEAVGGDMQSALPAACALEMIHTYSLIHDDLPAMDNDDLRRGKPTCHKVFGDAIAILAGDALLTDAFVILARAVEKAQGEARAKLDSVIFEIAAAASSRGMIAGQVIDILSEGEKLQRDALEALHSLKTGKLITASVLSGGLLGGASRSQLDSLRRYGRAIGLAFQVVDDILNATGNSGIMGKKTGTDAARGKATFVSIMGVEKARAEARSLIEEAVESIEAFDHRADPLRSLARFIVERKK
jgi:geranylgeranyl diphosphate synthase type II